MKERTFHGNHAKLIFGLGREINSFSFVSSFIGFSFPSLDGKVTEIILGMVHQDNNFSRADRLFTTIIASHKKIILKQNGSGVNSKLSYKTYDSSLD